MTHFVLLVTGENIDEQMAPFDEALEVEPHINMTKEEVEKEFQSYKARIEKYGAKTAFERKTLTLDHVTPLWWMQGQGEELDQEGNSLTTYNHNARWDWWEVGGRWAGSLILKNKKLCNSAKVEDIDWKVMDAEVAKKQDKFWDQVHQSDTYETIRKLGRCETDVFKDKESFVKQTGLWAPRAHLHEGVWTDIKGRTPMTSSREDAEARLKYIKTFREFLNNLPAGTTVTIVDCHI